MSRHIKLTGTLNPETGMVVVDLVQQTHIGDDFTSGGSRWFVTRLADGDIFYIGSVSTTTVRKNDDSHAILRCMDGGYIPITCTQEIWKKIKESVIHYNKKHSAN